MKKSTMIVGGVGCAAVLVVVVCASVGTVLYFRIWSGASRSIAVSELRQRVSDLGDPGRNFQIVEITEKRVMIDTTTRDMTFREPLDLNNPAPPPKWDFRPGTLVHVRYRTDLQPDAEWVCIIQDGTITRSAHVPLDLGRSRGRDMAIATLGRQQ